MKNRRMQLMMSLAAAALSLSLFGCGARRVDPSDKQTEGESETTGRVTERVTEKLTERPSASESETQRLVRSVDYTSKDGTVKLTLPDNTWKVTQDADEMRVFSAGTSAMINIVHAATASAMANLSVMTTEEDLKASLTKQYSDASAYEIVSYENNTYNNVNTYRYVVKFNATARMWAYSVTCGIVAADQAYVITGTVTDENMALLAAVEDSVDSFQVLKDETLKTVTGAMSNGTTIPTKEMTSEEELKTLTDYGYNATLYSNDTVNVRMAPGTDANILITIPAATKVTVVGETTTWFKVNMNGNIGYIRKDFLVYNQPTTETQQSETTAANDSDAITAELNTKTQYGSSTTLYASSEVNIRSQPGTSSERIGGLGLGDSVSVVGETANWFIVSVNGVTGYISKAYLVSDSSMVPASSESNGGNNGSGGNNGGTGGNGGSTGSTGGTQYVQGTIVSSGMNYLTVAGDDGTTYSIYYGDANTSSVDGLYEGVYVGVTLDNSQMSSDGTYYATNVQGF